MVDIARLTEVPLREVWPNEAADFTPWLAENLDRLGSALGIELELIQTEAPVGGYNVDILAEDADGRKIVIENQLNTTDHDHLGKVLTYAAGYNTDVMVWIVREFRDEHRQALDWLNQRTAEETEFYGVIVKAITIDSSRPAPLFDLVARPNDFRKSRISSSSGHASHDRETYQTFWQSIIDKLKDEHGIFPERKAALKASMSFPIGSRIGYTRISATLPKRSSDRTRVELRFTHKKNKDRNELLFDYLLNRKEIVEREFGESLTWERLDGKAPCRIAIYLQGRTLEDGKETLEATADLMVQKIVRFRDKLIPIVSGAVTQLGDSSDDALDYDEEDED